MFHVSKTQSTNTFDLIHSNVYGPMSVESIDGSRYVIEDFSHFFMPYILKKKSKALQRFKEYAAFMENQFGYRIRKL